MSHSEKNYLPRRQYDCSTKRINNFCDLLELTHSLACTEIWQSYFNLEFFPCSIKL